MPSIAEPTVLDGLEGRLRALRADTRRLWGTLTPEEVLCHLGDAATNVVGRLGDPAAVSRPLRKWVALQSWIPWPHGAETSPQSNPRIDGTRPSDFERSRERAITALRALAGVSPELLPSSHKVFGAMSPSDWLRWAYKHTDHHLRQFGL